jgi:hypothetical protein
MNKPNEKLLDKEWLKNQYEIQQKSMRTIAVELSVTTVIVSKYIKRYGFITRSAGTSKSQTSKNKGPVSHKKDVNINLQNKDWLYQKYIIEGLSTRDIVKLVGLVNRRVVKRALIHHGIPLRDLKEARKNRTKQGKEDRAPNKFTIGKEDYIIDQYLNNNKSVNFLVKGLGATQLSIQKILREANIPLRDCNNANIGRKNSQETINKMSKTATNQIIDGTRLSHCHGNKTEHVLMNGKTINMRSSWESKYAKYLESNNIDFKYESNAFLLSNSKHYIPDFYLTASDEYVEIKGYLSDDQSEKYELFRVEYPQVKWKILFKEDLLTLNIDLKLPPSLKPSKVNHYTGIHNPNLPTITLLIGAPSAGKSWIAAQLLDKYEYVSYDGNSKKDHLELLRTPGDKPKIYDPTFKIGTLIRRHSDEFNFTIVCIYETEEVLKERMASRGGKFTTTIMKRNEQVKKRFLKYGINGLIGTSSEVLSHLFDLKSV